jgi:hypothetical protein
VFKKIVLKTNTLIGKDGKILNRNILYYPFNAGIKSLRAALPDENFLLGFCFFNRAFRYNMREKPTNATIIHSVY